MSYKKIEDINYLYENIDQSIPKEVEDCLSLIVEKLSSSGYSDSAIECFIETSDEVTISELLNEKVKVSGDVVKQGPKIIQALKTFFKNRKLGNAVNKSKEVIKNNPLKTAGAVTGTSVVGSAALSDKDEKKDSNNNQGSTIRVPGIDKAEKVRTGGNSVSTFVSGKDNTNTKKDETKTEVPVVTGGSSDGGSTTSGTKEQQDANQQKVVNQFKNDEKLQQKLKDDEHERKFQKQEKTVERDNPNFGMNGKFEKQNKARAKEISPASFSTSQRQTRELLKKNSDTPYPKIEKSDLNQFNRSKTYTAADGKTQVQRSTVFTKHYKTGQPLGVMGKSQRQKYDLEAAAFKANQNQVKEPKFETVPSKFAANKDKPTFQRRDQKLLDKGLKPPTYTKKVRVEEVAIDENRMASHTAGMSDAQKDAATSSVSRSTADKMGRRSDEDAFKGRKKKTSARYSSTGGKKRKNTTGRGQPEQYRKSADSPENEGRYPYGRSKIVQGKGSIKGLKKEDFDAFDIVLGYLQESGQVDSIDEALYIMMEMDAATIQGIVRDFEILSEEAADKEKDDRLVKYGIGHDGSDKKAGSKRRSGGKRPKGKTPLQKETEKKYGKGVSPLEVVKKKIEDEHGKGAIA